jgi:hypothetical protein
MTHMKRHYSAALAAAFLLTAPSFAAKAEDAPAPVASPAAPAAAPADSPGNVARPSIVPKNDTAAKPDASVKPQADAEPSPRRHRRYAHRRYHRYAYWEPFPIYFPHLTRRHGVYWSRIPWFFKLFYLGMISAQTRSAFVARENYSHFRIMPQIQL